ncbi:Costars family protein ABRACL [Willisornis vidua]|nr:Costars family protein ABRACL [Willisornis vidua]
MCERSQRFGAFPPNKEKFSFRTRSHSSVSCCNGTYQSADIHWTAAVTTTMNVEHEISLLVEEIRRLGTKNADGQVSVKFGVLFADEKCANLFEALVGTLKAAKRRKIITYQGELLLQGVHDNVDIMLLQD